MMVRVELVQKEEHMSGNHGFYDGRVGSRISRKPMLEQLRVLETVQTFGGKHSLTQRCNPTAYLNLPPTSFFRPCAKVLFFQYPENFSGPTLKFRTWPFWGINGNGNHWVQTCETNIWWIFKPLALIHANKSTPSPNSWQGRIRI